MLISFDFTVWTLLYFTEHWSISLSPNAYSVGETNITLQCASSSYPFPSNHHNITFEFRQNKNYDWLTVAYSDVSGTLRIPGYSEENSISFLLFNAYYGYYYVTLTSIATVHNDRCIVHDELYPSFRCRAFNGSFVTSPEKSILSLNGNFFSWVISIFVWFYAFKYKIDWHY